MKPFFVIIFIVLLTHHIYAFETEFFFIGSINQEVPYKKETFFLKKGDTLKLYPVLKNGDLFLSPVDSFYADGALVHATSKLSEQMPISWYQIQPRLQEYSNLWEREDKSKGFIHVEPIVYEKRPLNEHNKEPFLIFPPSTDADHFGTYYFTAEITWDGKTYNQVESYFSDASPLNQKHPFKIIQVVHRKDDTFIGLLFELFNTPFIIAPKVTVDGFQETDSRMGSDCAAFAIYGRRRMGFKVPYCGPRGIFNYLSTIEDGFLWPKKESGTEVYVNRNGQSIKVGFPGLNPGDIVHFGEQVSVFYKDLGIKGILDKDDLLIQCYNTSPYITTIEKSEFYHIPIRLFRWKDVDH